MGLIKLAVIGGVVYWVVNRSKECHRMQDGRGNNRVYREWPTNPQQDVYHEPPPYHSNPRLTSQVKFQEAAEKSRTAQVPPPSPQQQRADMQQMQYEDFNERPLYIEQAPRPMDNEYYSSQRMHPRYQQQRVQDISDVPAWDLRGLRRGNSEPQPQQQQTRSGWFWH